MFFSENVIPKECLSSAWQSSRMVVAQNLCKWWLCQAQWPLKFVVVLELWKLGELGEHERCCPNSGMTFSRTDPSVFSGSRRYSVNGFSPQLKWRGLQATNMCGRVPLRAYATPQSIISLNNCQLVTEGALGWNTWRLFSVVATSNSLCSSCRSVFGFQQSPLKNWATYDMQSCMSQVERSGRLFHAASKDGRRK